MSEAALAMRLAVRSRIVARLNEIDQVLAECDDQWDGDIIYNFERERDYLVRKLRSNHVNSHL